MKIPRSIVLVVVGVISGAVVVTGVTAAVAAGSSGSSKTYYACLSKGELSKVGAKSPTCATGSKVISWNSVGPQGPPGPESQSTYADLVPTEDGDMVSVTLSLTSGTYDATWTVWNTNGGYCTYSASTNVTMTTPFDSYEYSALISVGTGGGSLTLLCQGNPPGGETGGALLTAVPTTIQ